MATRAEEISSIAEPERFNWLAGQLDEIHSEVQEGFKKIETHQAKMQGLLLGGLVGIIVGIIVIPVTLVWTSATAAQAGAGVMSIIGRLMS